MSKSKKVKKDRRPKTLYCKWEMPGNGESGFWCTYNNIEDAMGDEDSTREIFEAKLVSIGKFKRGVVQVK